VSGLESPQIDFGPMGVGSILARQTSGSPMEGRTTMKAKAKTAAKKPAAKAKKAPAKKKK
jgi:hypothetical protein